MYSSLVLLNVSKLSCFNDVVFVVWICLKGVDSSGDLICRLCLIKWVRFIIILKLNNNGCCV